MLHIPAMSRGRPVPQSNIGARKGYLGKIGLLAMRLRAPKFGGISLSDFKLGNESAAEITDRPPSFDLRHGLV